MHNRLDYFFIKHEIFSSKKNVTVDTQVVTQNCMCNQYNFKIFQILFLIFIVFIASFAGAFCYADVFTRSDHDSVYRLSLPKKNVNYSPDKDHEKIKISNFRGIGLHRYYKNNNDGQNITYFSNRNFIKLNEVVYLSGNKNNKDNLTVRFGSFPLNKVFDYENDEFVKGYAVEIINTISQISGWNYVIHKYKTKQDAINAIKANEIDILLPVSKADNDKYIANLSDDIRKIVFQGQTLGNQEVMILALNKSPLIFEDYDNFTNKKIGVLKGGEYLDLLKNYSSLHGFVVDLVEFSEHVDMMDALYAGAIDGVLTHSGDKLDNLKIIALIGEIDNYFLLNSQSLDLQFQLDATLHAIKITEPEFIHNLQEKYFSDASLLPFSKKELDYIKNSKQINVAFKREYPPYAYLDQQGKLSGVDVDLFKRLSKITNLEFNYVELPLIRDASKRLEYLKEHDIQIVAGVDNYLKFVVDNNAIYSIPYIVNYNYFMGPETVVVDNNINLRVGTIGTTYKNIQILQERYPHFTFVAFASPDELVYNLRRGIIDVLLVNRYTMNNILSRPENADIEILPGLTNVSFIQNEFLNGDENNFDITLISIIDKAISRLDHGDLMMDLNNHLENTEYQPTFKDVIYIYKEVFVASFILLFFVIVLTIYIILIKNRTFKETSKWERRLWSISKNIDGGALVLKANSSLTIVYANDGFLKLIGTTRELFEKNKRCDFVSFVHQSDIPFMLGLVNKAQTQHGSKLQILRTNGEYISVTLNCTFGRNIFGKLEVYCVINDTSNKEELVNRLMIERACTKIFFEECSDMFFKLVLSNNAVTVSSSFVKKLGWELPASLSVSEDKSLIQVFVKNFKVLNDDAIRLLEALYNVQTTKATERLTIKVKNELQNRFVWCEVRITAVVNDKNQVHSIFGVLHNVDDIISAKEKLYEQTKIDPLTNLHNKNAFIELTKEALLALPDQNHALILIDLDDFKEVNRIFGHAFGDKILCNIAEKLKVVFSNYDIISRFGGDQFLIFVKNIPYGTVYDKVGWLIEKLRENSRTPDGLSEYNITCSIGVCCTDLYGFDLFELLKNADISLYVSKEEGKDGFTFYRDIPKERLDEILTMYDSSNISKINFKELLNLVSTNQETSTNSKNEEELLENIENK